MTTRYDLMALNNLALSDTGHFCFLDAWTITALLSILSQNMPLYFWTNNQNPLTQSEIDELEHKLATAGGQLMKPLVGMIFPVCTEELPEGTLLCDGSILERADYPNLYDAIADGYKLDAFQFALPDLRDRFVLGAGVSHAAAAVGGNETITQTIDQLPSHSHSTVPHSHTEVTAVPAVVTVGLELPTAAAVPGAGFTGSSDVTINDSGGGEPMDIMPPYIALRYVVVAL